MRFSSCSQYFFSPLHSFARRRDHILKLVGDPEGLPFEERHIMIREHFHLLHIAECVQEFPCAAKERRIVRIPRYQYLTHPDRFPDLRQISEKIQDVGIGLSSQLQVRLRIDVLDIEHDKIRYLHKLKELILKRESKTIDLTDGSEASNEWWYRKAVAYDDEGGTTYYGNTYAEVSVAEQHMWLYQNGVVTLETDVVTGNPNLGNDTPKGAFRIRYHQAPATLRGPGYVTQVAYWMVFADDVGYHDATWQPYFGGSLYLSNGSHGCVNMPLGKAGELYELVYDGMPVFVY